MTDEEAKRYADKMGYTEAIWNVMQGYGIPYKKATKTKLVRLIGEVAAERSKIEKAVAEIESAKDTQTRIGLGCTDPQEREKHLYAEQTLALALEIIKRNIGEREDKVTEDEAKARWICCPMCDKERCERGADDCDVKRYMQGKTESEGER